MYYSCFTPLNVPENQNDLGHPYLESAIALSDNNGISISCLRLKKKTISLIFTTGCRGVTKHNNPKVNTRHRAQGEAVHIRKKNSILRRSAHAKSTTLSAYLLSA